MVVCSLFNWRLVNKEPVTLVNKPTVNDNDKNRIEIMERFVKLNKESPSRVFLLPICLIS